MATRKAPRKRIGRPPGSGVKGHIPVLVSLRPDQREALVAIANERRKPGERLPISEVVREALDRGLGIRGPLLPHAPRPVAVRVRTSPQRRSR